MEFDNFVIGSNETKPIEKIDVCKNLAATLTRFNENSKALMETLDSIKNENRFCSHGTYSLNKRELVLHIEAKDSSNYISFQEKGFEEAMQRFRQRALNEVPNGFHTIRIVADSEHDTVVDLAGLYFDEDVKIFSGGDTVELRNLNINTKRDMSSVYIVGNVSIGKNMCPNPVGVYTVDIQGNICEEAFRNSTMKVLDIKSGHLEKNALFDVNADNVWLRQGVVLSDSCFNHCNFENLSVDGFGYSSTDEATYLPFNKCTSKSAVFTESTIDSASGKYPYPVSFYGLNCDVIMAFEKDTLSAEAKAVYNSFEEIYNDFANAIAKTQADIKTVKQLIQKETDPVIKEQYISVKENLEIELQTLINTVKTDPNLSRYENMKTTKGKEDLNFEKG